MSVIALLLSSLPSFAGTIAAGAVIEDAATLDITPEGFDAVELLIPALLPSSIPVDDVDGGAYYITGLNVAMTVSDAQLVPGNGVLDLDATLLVSINDALAPFGLGYDIVIWSEDADGWVDPFEVDVHTTIGLNVVDDNGTPALDAVVGDIEVSYDLPGANIHLDGLFIDDVDNILSYVGLSVYELLIGIIDPYIQDAIAGFGPEIEAQIEDAFSAAVIQQEMDLNGVALSINLFPKDVVIEPEGVRVTMSGSMDAPAASCVAEFDTGGISETESNAPDIGSAPSGIPTPYHIGLNLSDEFGNQALYALWRGGLLCYAVEPGGDLPISLDTALVGSLTGNVFDPLFPEAQAVTLRTSPRAAPTMDYAGDHDVDVKLNQLDLDMYADVDGRQSRFVSLTLDGPVGVDLEFDAATGGLGVVLDLDAEKLSPSVGFNEFYAEQNTTVSDGFTSSFGSLVGTIVDGLLGDLSFTLPGLSGVGLTAMNFGNSDDWLGAYCELGAVSYETGSSCEEGCGGGGDCGGGCSSGGDQRPMVAFWAAAATLIGVRRRRV